MTGTRAEEPPLCSGSLISPGEVLFPLSPPGRKRYGTDKRELLAPGVFAWLIQQARLHDEDALVTLYQRALPMVYRYVLARLGQADLAEDVVSDVFLVMVEAIGDLRTEEEAGFYAWLIQIAQGKISKALRNLARNQKRGVSLSEQNANARSLAEGLVATDLVSDPAALHEWRETLDEVGQALGMLSPEQQVIVVGRFLAEQNIEELAQALGKQPGAIRVSQFRALKALAKHLGQERGVSRVGKGARG